MKLGSSTIAVVLISSKAAASFCPVSVSHAQLQQPALQQPFKRSPSPIARPPFQSSQTSSYASVPTSLNAFSPKQESNYLMDYFRTADGEIINPYRVLHVRRNADRKEIRHSYRTLSKKYHPDGVRFRNVLPGKCNSLDDVRDEWERVKLAYEILTDKKLRIKYDRHSALNDPAAAVGRMTLDVVGWGVTGLAKGVIDLGGMAVKSAQKTMKKSSDMNSNRSSGLSVRRSTNSGRNYSSHPSRTGDVMMMNINGMAMSLPANGVSFHQVHDHAQGLIVSHDPLEDIAKVTSEALSWGIFNAAKGVIFASDIAVKVTVTGLEMHRLHCESRKDIWKYKR